MTYLDQIPMPSWALNEGARTAIEQIIADRPDHWTLPRHAWTNTRHPKFKGEPARELRAIWEAARDDAMNANDRDRYIALGHEHPDDLVERVLRETKNVVPYTKVRLVERADGGSIAA